MTDFSDLAAMQARDAETGALWFTGPKSFTSLAVRDRRALLRMLDEARSMVDYPAATSEMDSAQSVPANMVESDKLFAAVCKYGQHLDGCQWCVFPPGERDCTCGLHAIIASWITIFDIRTEVAP